MTRSKTVEVSVDETDLKLLELLRANARISLASLARKVRLSKSAVKYRLDRLVEVGAIKSFFALVDSQVYGLKLSVVFDLTVEPQVIQDVAMHLAKYPEVVRVYELTTSPQLHVHVLFKDQEAMEKFMRSKLYTLTGIKDVNTGMIIKRYKTDLTLQI